MSFAASPSAITVGDTSVLQWNVQGADTLDLQPLGVHPVGISYQVQPVATTTYSLTAANAYGSVSANVTLPVYPDVSVSTSPVAATMLVGASKQFSATVTGATDPTVAWTVTEGMIGGAISDAGLYIASSNPGQFHIQATSNANPTRSAVAVVNVEYPDSGVIDPGFGDGGYIFFSPFVDAGVGPVTAYANDAEIIFAVGGATPFNSPALVSVLLDGSTNRGFGNGGSIQVMDGGFIIGGMTVGTQGGVAIATDSMHGAQDYYLLALFSDGGNALGFGPPPGGLVDVGLGCSGHANAITRSPNGGYFLGGACGGYFAAVALTSSGSPDATFGTSGHVQTAIGPSASANAVTFDQQGRSLMGGSVGNLFGLARFEPDGGVDSSFNGTGSVSGTVPGTQAGSSILQVFVQSDGKILVSGACSTSGGMSAQQWCMARFLDTGATDTAFAVSGYYVGPAGGGAVILLDASNRIVAAKNTSNSSQIEVARYLGDGSSLDPSFGVSSPGKTLLMLPGAASATGMRFLPDGRILVTGNYVASNGSLVAFAAALWW